jgi:CRISPR-associated protein Cas1
MSLWDRIVEFETLHAAWAKVRSNGGAAGGDGVTIDVFSQDAIPALRDLSDALKDGSWRSGPCRRVDIPKRKGGTRRLTIPTVIDRIVHTAVAETLDPILDPQFEESSFAYREGRSVRHAVARIETWRDRGYRHVIEADIVGFFDAVGHPLLLQKLSIAVGARAGAESVKDLVADILDASAIELGTPGQGLLQGSPLSPLLANLYLDALDERIDAAGIKIVRFADDFVILCKSSIKAEAALAAARNVLREHGLKLHKPETRVSNFDDGFEFLGHLFLKSLALQRGFDDRAAPRQKPEAQVQSPPETAETAEPPARKDYDRGPRVMYLVREGIQLGLRNRSFAVSTPNGAEIAAVSHSRADRIEVGPDVGFDIQVLDHCVATDTDLAFVDGDGATRATVRGTSVQRGALQMAQAACILDDPLRVGFARRLVDARIRNQRTQLFRLNRRVEDPDVRSALKFMGRTLRKLPYAVTIDELRGLEGAASADYWPALGRLTKGASNPFLRTRPATDLVNAAINYMTGILERDIRTALNTADLHLGFGVLHQARDRADAAIYDLMEPFRAPLTEGLAAYLFNSARLLPTMFEGTDVGGIRILPEARRRIITGYEQAVAKRVNITGGSGKLAWRAMMRRQALDLAKAYRRNDPALFEPYLMEA